MVSLRRQGVTRQTIAARTTTPAATTAIAGLALLALSGCATLSEGECKTADWYQIGQQDGRAGHPRARLHDHGKACAKYGIRPQHKSYYAGRQVGLAYYCTPDNGFRVGRNGQAYQGVCPARYEPAFLAEYRKGEAIHAVSEDIEAVENEIDRMENRLDDEDTTPEQADALRRQLRDSYHELRYLNRELSRLERRYDRVPASHL